MSSHLCWKCGIPIHGSADVCGQCGAARTGKSSHTAYPKAHGVFRLEQRPAGCGGWSGPDLADQLEYIRDHRL